MTAFGVFKYMAAYSMTQFTTVLLLYWVGANLTDPEFLWIDLFLISTLFITCEYESMNELDTQIQPNTLYHYKL